MSLTLVEQSISGSWIPYSPYHGSQGQSYLLCAHQTYSIHWIVYHPNT